MKRMIISAQQGIKRDPVLSVCLLLAVVQVILVVYPDPKLQVWPDSIGYLGPAVDTLELGFFSHWYGRGFLYPLFLLGLLKISPEPTTIVYAQRVLVVFTYAGLAASVWLVARQAVRQRLSSPIVLAALSAFWLLVYVVYSPSIFLAHTVMAETFFSALLVLVLLSLLLIGLPEISIWIRSAATCIACITSVALVVVKPHWLLAAFTLPVLLFWLLPKVHRRRLTVIGIAALLLSVFIFLVPERLLQEKYDPYASKVFGPKTLFCNSADLIHAYLADRDEEGFSNSVRASLSKIVAPAARAASAQHGWAILGFDGDKCTYGDAASVISKQFARNPDAEKSYFFETYFRALMHRPGYLIFRLTNQMFALARTHFSGAGTTYFISNSTIRDSRDLRKLYGQWSDLHRDDLIGFVETPFVGWEIPLVGFCFLAGILLFLAIIFFVLRLIVNVFKGVPLAWAQRNAAAALILYFAINMLIGAVHSFDIWRYAAMQAPLFSLLGMLLFLAFFQPDPRSEHEYHPKQADKR